MCYNAKKDDVWLISSKGYDIVYDIIEHIEMNDYLYLIEHVHDVKK